jgi:hypothetical protein
VPCWEGIVPGQTTKAQALDLLQHNPLVDRVDKVNLSWVGVGGEPAPFGDIGFGSQADPKDDIAYYIRTLTPAYSVKLSEIIHAFGMPTHVMVYRDSKQDLSELPMDAWTPVYGFVVVYLNKGFEISSDGSDPPPLLNGDLKFSDPSFFVPGADGYNRAHHYGGYDDLTMDDLVEWQGFKDFNFYCTNTKAVKKNCLGQK